MKQHHFLLSALIALFSMSSLQGQSFGGFELFMDYSLVGTVEDATGNHGPVELTNARYAGDSGIWSNGIYVHDTLPGGSLVQTPQVDILRKDSLIISAEIYVDSFANTSGIILMAGGSYRYLGCSYYADGEMNVVVNGVEFQTNGPTISAGTWQSVAVGYTRADSTVHLYVNGNEVYTRTGLLFAPEDDNQVSNTHYGSGRSFKGYMRNLRVWQPASFTTSVEEGNAQDSERIEMDLSGN